MRVLKLYAERIKFVCIVMCSLVMSLLLNHTAPMVEYQLVEQRTCDPPDPFKSPMCCSNELRRGRIVGSFVMQA